MGTRVSFYLGGRDGLADLTWDHLDAFELWAQAQAQEWPEEASPALASLRRVRAKSDPLQVSSADEAVDLDLVMDTFIGDYCDFGGGGSLRRLASEGVYYARHYVEAQASIADRSGERAVELWSTILRGRGVGDNREAYPYTPSDAVFRVAFWDRDECRELLRLLAGSFGPLVSKARAGAARRSATGADLAIETVVEALLCSQSQEVGLVVCVA